MTLSVCIICKNEVKNIVRCLDSILSIADEIIVVDTGSTDGTLALLDKYPILLIHYPWQDNFSEARNISLSHASCDWILILDADEIVDTVNGHQLITLLRSNPSYEGLFLCLINMFHNTPTTQTIVLRVFKNNPLYRFEGKIHEQILPSILNHHSQQYLLDTPIQIFHYGYDPVYYDESTKRSRNLTLLLSFEETAKDGYYYYVLGNEYAHTDNIYGCINAYKQSLTLTDLSNERPIYLAYLLFNLIDLLLQAEQITEAYHYFKTYLPYFTDFKDLYFLGALCALGQRRFHEAASYMILYDTTLPKHHFYPSTHMHILYDIPKIRWAINKGIGQLFSLN